MFFIAYAFKGHVHAFAGRVKVVSHLSCRTSAIFKYFVPCSMTSPFYEWLGYEGKIMQGKLSDHRLFWSHGIYVLT